MQVQHISELNVGSSKQPEANKSIKSARVDRADSQQHGDFDEHMEHHLQHSKKSGGNKNNEEKQRVNEQASGERANTEGAKVDREELVTGDREKTADSENFSITSRQASPELQINGIDSTDVEMISTGIETAVELPQTGNLLPPTELAEQEVKSLVQPGGEVVLQQVVEPGAEPITVMTSDIKQMLLNTAEEISKQPVMQTVVNKQAAAASQLTNKDVNLTEKINVQGGIKMPVMAEAATTEVITQSTRMQNVPLVTEVASNSAFNQNLKVFSPPVMPEANTLSNNPGTFFQTPGSSLSSAISTHLQSPQWPQQMTEQFSFMVKGGFQQAELKLNPAHLGPMEIKLVINDDRASVSFVTQHAMVRDAIDTAMPRLREMLEQQGLNLADADVSTQSQQKQAQKEADSQSGDEGSRDANASHENNEVESEGGQSTVNVESAVNIYA